MINNDKFQHIFVWFVLTLFLRTYFNNFDTIIISFSLGIIKEIIDSLIGSKFCIRDLLADVVGISLGILL
jgi:hypothetical protein